MPGIGDRNLQVVRSLFQLVSHFDAEWFCPDNTFVDTVTQTGKHVADAKANHSVDVTIEEDGTYLLVPGQAVNLGQGTLNFAEGQVGIDLTDPAVQQALQAGQTVTASVTCASIKGEYRPMTTDESLKVSVSQDGNTLTLSVSKQ